MEYNILSPDGITIEMENFPTLSKATQAFTQWRKRYKAQGYYSSNNGRIPLNQLKHECQMIMIENGKIINKYFL